MTSTGTTGIRRRRMGSAVGVDATPTLWILRARRAAACPSGSRWLGAGLRHEDHMRTRNDSMRQGVGYGLCEGVLRCFPPPGFFLPFLFIFIFLPLLLIFSFTFSFLFSPFSSFIIFPFSFPFFPLSLFFFPLSFSLFFLPFIFLFGYLLYTANF